MFSDIAWSLYWYLVTGSITSVMAVFGVSGCMVLLFCSLAAYKDYEMEASKGFFKWAIIALLIASPRLFYPTKSEVTWILGGSTALTLGSSIAYAEGAKELPQNIVNAANYFLKEFKDNETEE